MGVRTLVALLTLLVLTLVAPAPRIALAESQSTTIPARIRLFQEYKVPVSGLRNTFEYKIEPVENDAPLPVDEKGDPLHSFTLTRDDELWLTFPVEVTADPNAAPYVYQYKIGPAQTTLPDGLYYADVLSTSLSPGINEYHLEIHVQPSSTDAEASVVTPTVHVEGWDGPKVTDPGWRIAYQKKGTGSGGTGGSNANTRDSDASPQAPADSGAKPAQTNDSPAEKASSNPSNSSSRTSSASSTGTGSQSSTTTSRTTLSRTGDTTPDGIVCAIAGGASLLAWHVVRRMRAGEGHA
jgi:hypothetical protein